MADAWIYLGSGEGIRVGLVGPDAEGHYALDVNATFAGTVVANDPGIPDTLGQKARAASLGATLSTEDQAILDAIKAAVERNSSAGTSVVTRVDDSATNVTLKAANANRRGLYIFNDSDQILYIKFGATATITDFTVKVAAGGFYEMPPGPVYTGIVDGIWAAGSTGAAQVTELTA